MNASYQPNGRADVADLPWSREAEQAAIGSILFEPEAYREVAGLVTYRDFHDDHHSAIFSELTAMQSEGVPLDPVILKNRLQGNSVFESETTPGLLLELGKSVSTSAHAKHFAAIVKEKSDLRILESTIQDCLHDTKTSGKSASELLCDFQVSIEDLQRGTDNNKCAQFIFKDLLAAHPRLKAAVVHGLFRLGETVNIIAASKVGKSWLAYYILLCIVAGRLLFDRFQTSKGKVLLVDNELHPCTLAQRIPLVAEAMGLEPNDYETDLVVLPLRGNLRTLVELEAEFDKFEPGELKVILYDAKYRFLGEGVSENDNSAETALYNQLDRIAEKTGAANILIHHSSKGSQSDKRVTDIGSGAGAQSRAADCHIVLREHEEPGVVVLESAVRSFAPANPLGLRWEFPLWTPDLSVDPQQLKRQKSKGEERQAGLDREGTNQIVDALLKGPATASKLREATGLSKGRFDRLVNLLQSQGHVTHQTITIRGNDCREFSIVEDTK